jgi:CHAD domain-containing protein
MEIEAKYAVPDVEVLVRLETLPTLAGYEIDAGERRHDLDTFLDTADRRFLAAGYYLRRRETAGGVRLTLKELSGGVAGIHRREELEALVAADVPPAEWPPGELRARVRAIVADTPLEPFLQLSQERLARRVCDGGRDVAELSLDRVLLDGAVGRRWFEVELELRADGTEDDLSRLTAALLEVGPLAPESRSKFARALETAAADPAAEAANAILLPPRERVLHEDQARKAGARGRRALALLALDDGLTQVEAGRRAGLSDRRVRYWLSRYRGEGVAIYGTVAAAAPPAGAAPSAAETEVVTAPAGAATASAAGAAATAEAGAPAIDEPEADAVVADEPADASAADEPADARVIAPATPKKRPGIAPSDSMTAAAASTLRLHLARMLEHEAGTRLGEDPEELHDMRVSTRRMRMALRVFADYLDRDTLRPVLKGLRRTGDTLGAVRDLDVFHEKTRLYLDSLPEARSGELGGLLAAWCAARDLQRERLMDYLDGERYRRFVETTTELLDGPLERLVPRVSGGPRPQRVSQVLPGILFQDMAVVWAFESQIDGPQTPLPVFHALRKACKGLRYTLEFFEGVLGPGAKPLIKTVKGMQDHLGDLQDAVVTCGVLRDFITWGEWRHHGHTLPEPTELVVAPGAARYMAARQEEMERLVLGFPEVWPTVAGVGFSRDLATVIAEI